MLPATPPTSPPCVRSSRPHGTPSLSRSLFHPVVESSDPKLDVALEGRHGQALLQAGLHPLHSVQADAPIGRRV
ncbi:hypothetical protein H696_01558 [Fonticula alba]|uniref:Uncharacterized protein n=1 Tax=Fonticula alba TaxID=691883 RepID=A0A058ZDX4_FONAL|nr:hypothetical protein H696_01558 [Fonticula alba]KCV72156.1 hypothetical protein H696_01558 [Fonticula alba]|eukprot:XP_009493734.1 hypothetical protein H696_01558 [Fonticula alba]